MENGLRRLRKVNGLTQDSLAQKAKVPRSVIARFETGRTELSTRNLTKLAAALGCSMEEIVSGGQTDGKVAECG